MGIHQMSKNVALTQSHSLALAHEKLLSAAAGQIINKNSFYMRESRGSGEGEEMRHRDELTC